MPLSVQKKAVGLENKTKKHTLVAAVSKNTLLHCSLAILLTGFLHAAAAKDMNSLDNSFAAPPPLAKPWVYWYFMDGNLTHDGMMADLRAMKDARIGGAIFLEVNQGIPR